jgi:hypothetical protein
MATTSASMDLSWMATATRPAHKTTTHSHTTHNQHLSLPAGMLLSAKSIQGSFPTPQLPPCHGKGLVADVCLLWSWQLAPSCPVTLSLSPCLPAAPALRRRASRALLASTSRLSRPSSFNRSSWMRCRTQQGAGQGAGEAEKGRAEGVLTYMLPTSVWLQLKRRSPPTQL